LRGVLHELARTPESQRLSLRHLKSVRESINRAYCEIANSPNDSSAYNLIWHVLDRIAMESGRDSAAFDCLLAVEHEMHNNVEFSEGLSHVFQQGFIKSPAAFLLRVSRLGATNQELVISQLTFYDDEHFHRGLKELVHSTTNPNLKQLGRRILDITEHQ